MMKEPISITDGKKPIAEFYDTETGFVVAFQTEDKEICHIVIDFIFDVLNRRKGE